MKTKYLLAIIGLFFFQSTAFSQTHIWTGVGGDNNWFNLDNWNSGTVPSTDSDVLIPNGFIVEISGESANANSITINGISTLNIQNDLSLPGFMSITAGSNINWFGGTINGGGIIENNGLMHLESFEDKKLINSTIENNGLIYILNSNMIRLSGGCLINNNETGIIDILSNGGIMHDEPGNTMNNMGIIRKLSDGSGNLGSFFMIFDLNNAGIIEIEENQQFLFLGGDFTLNNLETGILQGFGTFDITTNFTNVGTFSPGNGGNTGALSVFNNFSLTPQAILEFDIAGTLPGEYDVIDVAGFPDLEGNIIVNLAFAPELGDEFPIITANEIMSCDFPQFISAQFSGFDYTFKISCNSTSLIIEVVDIILGTENNPAENTDFYIQPNPVKSFAHIIFDAPGNLINPNQVLSLHVFNSNGLEVKSIGNLTQENFRFHKGNLSAGIYILQINSRNIVLATTKVIIE